MSESVAHFTDELERIHLLMVDLEGRRLLASSSTISGDKDGQPSPRHDMVS